MLEPGYRLATCRNAGGKSGQHRAWQLLTATRGNSRESATETIPPEAINPGKGEKSEVRAHDTAW
jgi:hypothetical protein